MNNAVKTITIIGGGPAGALMSIFLARLGFAVHIFEARNDIRLAKSPSGRSINLALATRGISALKAAGVYEVLEPELIAMYGRQLHLTSSEQRFQPYSYQSKHHIYSISRARLNQILLEQAEAHKNITLHFNHQCQQIDTDKKIISFNHNQRHAYELIIGADGANSVVRHAIQQHTTTTSQVETLPHSYKELSIPPSTALPAPLEPNALHIWPRGEYMLIALPNLDGSFTATFFCPNTGDHNIEHLNEPSAIETFFKKEFSDFVELVPDYLEQFNHNPTSNLATIRCQPWYYLDQMVLIGDAAHTIVPFHGQGMNCAFEDCQVLAGCFEQYGSDNVQVFAHFEVRRKVNADAIADMALENYLEMRKTVAEPAFQLQKQLEWALQQRFPEHFMSRYEMVMFNTLPYAVAKQRGAKQAQILKTLLDGKERIEEIDFDLANRLILQRLPPAFG